MDKALQFRTRHVFLTFLLFFQTLSDGGGHFASGKLYGEPCTIFRECSETKFCHPTTFKCDCAEQTRSSSGQTLIQVFHEKKRKCFSPVGSACLTDEHTKKTDDGGYMLNCVPHAHCKRYQSFGVAERFGVCECDPNYERGYNGLCEKIEEKVVYGDIWSAQFDGKVGFPDTNGRTANAENSPKAAKLEDDVTNENKDFDIPKEKVDKIAKALNGGAAVISITASIFITLGLILANTL